MIAQTDSETMPAPWKMRRFLLSFLLILAFSALCQAQEKKKVAYAVFVDNSGSMRTQFEKLIRISQAVVHQIHKHGPVSIFDFHSQGRVQESRAVAIARIEQVQDWDLLEQCLDDLYIEGGQTTLLDAIQVMAEHLGEKAAGPNFSERVIILITDGEERKSAVRQKQLMQKLTELKIRVYAIGLVDDLGSQRSKAVDFLRDVTRETGGRAVFPKYDREDLQGLLTELAIPIQ
jgi:uncharacterized protein with von Willebrand factor type A (vWA) domain